MLQIIAPLVQKFPPGTPVFYVHDGTDERFSTVMMNQLARIGATDISEDDQLWRSIGMN